MNRVLIAGSGVAAVEAVLALRQLAGRRCGIDLLAPTHALVNRPAPDAERRERWRGGRLGWLAT